MNLTKIKVWKSRDYFRMIKRRIFVIILPGLFAGSCIFFYLKSLPGVYKSEAVIEFNSRFDNLDKNHQTAESGHSHKLLAMSQQVLNESNLESIIKRNNLYPAIHGQSTEDRIQRMREDITIEAISQNLIHLAYQSHDPYISNKISAELVQLFISEKMEGDDRPTVPMEAAVDGHLTEVESRLHQQENQLSDFRMLNLNESPDQQNARRTAVNRLKEQLQLVTVSISKLQLQKTNLARQRSGMNPFSEQEMSTPHSADTIPPDSKELSANNASSSEPGKSSANRDPLLNRHLNIYPSVPEPNEHIKELEKSAQANSQDDMVSAARKLLSPVGKEENRVPSPDSASPLEDWKAQLDAIDKQLEQASRVRERIRQEISDDQTRIDAMQRLEQTQKDLQQDYETTLQKYQTLLVGKKAGPLTNNTEEGKQTGQKFRLLNPASFPFKPSEPYQLLFFVFSGGLFLGVMLAALLEFFDHSIRTERELISHTHLPVLVSIPFISCPGRNSNRKHVGRFFAKLINLDTRI